MKLASRQGTVARESEATPPQGESAAAPEHRAISAALARRWALILACALVGALLGGLAANLMPERFEASSYLLVTVEEGADIGTSATAYAQAFSRIARQPAVLAEVPEEAEVDAFGQDLTLTAAPDAPIIEVVGSAETPELATLRANAVSRTIEEYVADKASETGFGAAVLTEAIVPGASLPARTAPGVAAGLAVGAFIGVVVALAYPARSRQRRDRPDNGAQGPAAW